MSIPLVLDLLVATLVGLAVGLEREWSGHATGPDARFAGLRTFALLGLIGGFGGWQLALDHQLMSICIVGGAIVFPIAAYVSALRRPGTTTDGTTEVSAMLVVAMGVAAGSGHRSLAAAAAALVVALLAEKSALQAGLRRLDSAELRATVQFAVMALVILPVLPDGAYGPFGAFRPRQLWTVVLMFSALNFAGYIARRIVGETRGLGVTGLLGGLVSSTAVSLTFSRRSRIEPALSAPLALGVVAACTVLLPRITVIASGLQPLLLAELFPLLALPFVAGAALVAVALWRERDVRPREPHPVSAPDSVPDSSAEHIRDAHDQPHQQRHDNAHHHTHHTDHQRDGSADTTVANGMLQNPLALGTSLQMAVAFQLVLVAIAWIQSTVGNPGVLASAALLGLTDMDALTLSMTRLATDATTTHIAALAIGIGVIANTLLKLTMVVTLGSPAFRMRAAPALLGLAAVGALTLWWQW